MAKSNKKREDRRPDPHKAFRMATAFWGFTQVVADRYPNDFERPDCFELVGCVNLAFSLELYLKCLVYLEGNEPHFVHDTQALFEQLDTETKIAARRLYGEYRTNEPHCQQEAEWVRRHGGNPDEEFAFDNALRQSAEAFEKLRYAYEGEGSPFTIGALVIVVRKIILDRMPEWNPQARNPDAL